MNKKTIFPFRKQFLEIIPKTKKHTSAHPHPEKQGEDGRMDYDGKDAKFRGST